MNDICEWYYGDNEEDFDMVYTSCGQRYDLDDVENEDICPHCIKVIEYAK